jgi:c-di-GMP-binding flagellar brake protein YcgR
LGKALCNIIHHTLEADNRLNENKDKSMQESTELIFNRREYSRVDAYIPLEYRRISEEEREKIKSRISGEVMLANFNVMPPLENHPQMECLTLLNKKLDTIVQMLALQSEGFHSLPFKFVSLSGSGMQFSSQQHFTLGDILELKMILTLYQPAAIYVYGEIVRVGSQSSGYFVNVHFTEITDTIRDTIIHFIFETERKMLRESKEG